MHPERSDGAYAVEDFLRRSHLRMSGSPEDLLADGFDGPSAVSGVLRDILPGDRQTEFVIDDVANRPEEPSVVEHDAYRARTLDIFLAIASM